jgi:hypothetical protein
MNTLYTSMMCDSNSTIIKIQSIIVLKSLGVSSCVCEYKKKKRTTLSCPQLPIELPLLQLEQCKEEQVGP